MAATSACNAWAVGYKVSGSTDRTLIEHWNGEAWKVQSSPNPGGGGHALNAAAASSATNAWAVGEAGIINYGPNDSNRTVHGAVLEHWNGKAWKIQRNPKPGQAFYGITATTASNAWAVGVALHTGQALIEHWNGKAWKIQRNPSPRSAVLDAVTATSATSAWAVGYTIHTGRALIEHWNGKSWKIQRNPSPRSALLDAVTAISATDAWAVGSVYTPSGLFRTLILRWNGKSWKVPSPNPAGLSGDNRLLGVTAASATSAWAVGYKAPNQAPRHTLVEHWNGKAWKIQKSPDPAGSRRATVLYGVTATSATHAWTIGSAGSHRLVLYWNGTAWKP